MRLAGRSCGAQEYSADKYCDLNHQMRLLEESIRERIGEPKAKSRALVNAALEFAMEKHKGQFRKDEEAPYVIHPVRTCVMLASEMGVTSPEVLAAALLHDTMEDCSVREEKIRDTFGPKVASLVKELSENFYTSEEEHLAHLRDSSEDAKMLKVADRIDNLRSINHGTQWTDDRIRDYLTQTEEYVIPLANSAEGLAKLRQIMGPIKRTLLDKRTARQ